MAKLALAIPYSTLPARMMLALMSILFPIWAIILPIWFCLFVLLLLKIPGVLPPLQAGTIIALLFFIPSLALLCTACCEDDRILISEVGMCFPISFLVGLRFKREFEWRELTALKLNWQGGKVFGASDRINLFFQNGARAQLSLNRISKQDLEQLVLALILWAGHRGDEYHLLQLQSHLRGGAAEEKRLSITQLWEDELANRFKAIMFEPLPANSFLQGRRYRIVKTLNFGGFSAAYLAQRDGQELFLVKELIPDKNAAEREIRMSLLNNEAWILAKLNHPQIPRLIDHFVEQDRHYLVLEYISGYNLRQLVGQCGRQKESDVLAWAISACNVLDYLHHITPAILHLDVTPENLILRRDSTLALVDFGSARRLDGQVGGASTFKPFYAGPEQLSGCPVLASDIFALGCTINFLLTGQDISPKEGLAPRLLNENVSPEMDTLVRKCTNLSVTERFFSANILKAELVRLDTIRQLKPLKV